MKKRKFFKIFLGSFLLVYGIFVGIFGFLFLGSVVPADKITWGTTFAQSQAKDLGLNWQETYLALLDDLGVRNFRLPVYWDELEKEKGIFDFSPWDFQLAELEKREGKAILAIGFKLPRWPECRFPKWYSGLSDIEKEGAIFNMIRAIVEHHKDNSTVWAWQIENEPLLKFGICPEKNSKLLDKEIKFVRKLDPSRPIIITDTGEFSVWYEAGKRADILGSTLYRVIHDPALGFVEYKFLNPTFYARKVLLLHLWSPTTRVIVSELQAEPWVQSLPISSRPLEEQHKTMSPERFSDNIDFARRTGIDEFYLWGSEWWYWLKMQGEEDIWEKARELF